MNQLRRAVAYPVFMIAFLFHLPAMFFTCAAMWISGDDPDLPFEMTKRHLLFIAASLLMAVLLVSPTLYAALKPSAPTAAPRLEIVRPMKNEEFEKADPAKIPALIPAIKLTACIFAEKAVRNHVRPAPVSLPSCGGHAKVTISDNLIDITVSGIATIDKIDQTFRVTLQHNPPSTTEDGLIITSISLGD